MHGIGHIVRVLVWSAQIAARMDAPVRRAELLWAAGLHDIKRWDDDIDPRHGERAADWVLHTFAQVRPAEAAHLDVSLIATLCRNHHHDDRRIPPSERSTELWILKDADALDRVRIHDLDVQRLRFAEISPTLAKQALAFMKQSTAQGNDVDAVRRVAQKLGLWV